MALNAVRLLTQSAPNWLKHTNSNRHLRTTRWRILVVLLLIVPKATAEPVYETRTASRDGIGKIYLGREISHVMGHLGADWLERPAREREERTDLLLEALPLRQHDTVADLGAGTGYFSFPVAKRVPQGRVVAVDLQPEMIDIIRARSQERGTTNITPQLATATSPRLEENTVDLVLMVDAYHEFSHPAEVMQEVVKALKTNGRVVLVEYRGEDPAVPIKALHKMTVKQAKREMAAVGLALEKNDQRLPRQHIMIFSRSTD